jgi:F-type H+-transporting ATPase subunit epsilon
MADNQFLVQVVTPERVLIDATAVEVILRTGEGDTTFLAGHAPLVGTVEPGVIRVVLGGGEFADVATGDELRVAAHGGFVQVEQHVEADEGPGAEPGGATRVTLLLGVAELAEEIDVSRAQTALEAAEARVTELGGSASRGGDDEAPDAELVEASAAVLRATVRLEAVDATGGQAGSAPATAA